MDLSRPLRFETRDGYVRAPRASSVNDDARQSSESLHRPALGVDVLNADVRDGALDAGDNPVFEIERIGLDLEAPHPIARDSERESKNDDDSARHRPEPHPHVQKNPINDTNNATNENRTEERTNSPNDANVRVEGFHTVH